MKEKRAWAAAVIHNDKLHVFGGYSGSRLQTTETINVDGEVSYGPDLPTAVSDHAMTKINGTVSLLWDGRMEILTLPKHGTTTMTLRPLHLGLIYWKEEDIMALHSMWTR